MWRACEGVRVGRPTRYLSTASGPSRRTILVLVWGEARHLRAALARGALALRVGPTFVSRCWLTTRSIWFQTLTSEPERMHLCITRLPTSQCALFLHCAPCEHTVAECAKSRSQPRRT